MTTVNDLVAATERHLLSTIREQMDLLQTSVTASDTSFVFTYGPSQIAQGSELSVGDEVVFVWSYTVGTKTAVVLRGHRGSTPAAHSSGAVLKVNPRFPRYDILRELQNEIRSYEPELFRVSSATTTALAEDVNYARSYPLDQLESAYGVIRVTRSPSGTATTWRDVSKFDLLRDLPTTQGFTSGFGLMAYEDIPVGSTIQVLLAVPFDLDDFAGTTEIVDDIGMLASSADLPPLGAAWRLIQAREAARGFGEAQSEPRTAAETPVGSATTAGRGFKLIRDERKAQEARKMVRLYPIRSS